jgi:hypothetical protein
MSEIQSILFKNDFYNVGMARIFLKRNNITPMKLPDKQENYIRFRINDPAKYKYFITEEINPYIKIVIGLL